MWLSDRNLHNRWFGGAGMGTDHRHHHFVDRMLEMSKLPMLLDICCTKIIAVGQTLLCRRRICKEC